MCLFYVFVYLFCFETSDIKTLGEETLILSIVQLIWKGCSITSRDENDFLTHLRLLKRVVFFSHHINELPVQNTGNIGLLCEYGRVFV